MLEVKKEGIILEKRELDFEKCGVLNPGIYQEGDKVHVFYRAVTENNHSTLGYCILKGPLTVEVRFDQTILAPVFTYESHGVEDARIVKIDDLYYLTYTAYDGINALGCLATSENLIHFKHYGIIVPKISLDLFRHVLDFKPEMNEKYYRYNKEWKSTELVDSNFVWDKNVVFFPRRIQGKLCFLHRIKPEVQLVQIQELSDLTPEFWEDYLLHLEDHIVLSAKYKHEVSYIGGGCPPIETEHGWLVIYHSVYDTLEGYVYVACAALLELENPQNELSRLPYPLIVPEEIWERKGEVNNVCFPTGTAIFGDQLYIYYGAADERIACASMSFSGLVNTLNLLITTPN